MPKDEKEELVTSCFPNILTRETLLRDRVRPESACWEDYIIPQAVKEDLINDVDALSTMVPFRTSTERGQCVAFDLLLFIETGLFQDMRQGECYTQVQVHGGRNTFGRPSDSFVVNAADRQDTLPHTSAHLIFFSQTKLLHSLHKVVEYVVQRQGRILVKNAVGVSVETGSHNTGYDSCIGSGFSTLPLRDIVEAINCAQDQYEYHRTKLIELRTDFDVFLVETFPTLKLDRNSIAQYTPLVLEALGKPVKAASLWALLCEELRLLRDKEFEVRDQVRQGRDPPAAFESKRWQAYGLTTSIMVDARTRLIGDFCATNDCASGHAGEDGGLTKAFGVSSMEELYGIDHLAWAIEALRRSTSKRIYLSFSFFLGELDKLLRNEHHCDRFSATMLGALSDLGAAFHTYESILLQRPALPIRRQLHEPNATEMARFCTLLVAALSVQQSGEAFRHFRKQLNRICTEERVGQQRVRNLASYFDHFQSMLRQSLVRHGIVPPMVDLVCNTLVFPSDMLYARTIYDNEEEVGDTDFEEPGCTARPGTGALLQSQESVEQATQSPTGKALSAQTYKFNMSEEPSSPSLADPPSLWHEAEAARQQVVADTDELGAEGDPTATRDTSAEISAPRSNSGSSARTPPDETNARIRLKPRPYEIMQQLNADYGVIVSHMSRDQVVCFLEACGAGKLRSSGGIAETWTCVDRYGKRRSCVLHMPHGSCKEWSPKQIRQKGHQIREALDFRLGDFTLM